MHSLQLSVAHVRSQRLGLCKTSESLDRLTRRSLAGRLLSPNSPNSPNSTSVNALDPSLVQDFKIIIKVQISIDNVSA